MYHCDMALVSLDPQQADQIGKVRIAVPAGSTRSWREQAGRWLALKAEAALTVWFLRLVDVRAWAIQRGARWIVQQSARGVATSLLVVAGAAHSPNAHAKLASCAIAAMLVDGLCLCTGSHREARQVQAAYLYEIRKWEAQTGITYHLRDMLAASIYDRVRFRGLVPAWIWLGLQLVAFSPMTVHPAASTVPFFLLLLLREIVYRFGPFTVPVAGRWKPTVLL